MKKYIIFFMCICSYTYAQNIVDNSEAPISIHNFFGLTEDSKHPFLFNKSIRIKSSSKTLKPLEDGTLIYTNQPYSSVFPSLPHGNTNIVVIENNNHTRYQYSNFKSAEKLNVLSFKPITPSLSLGDLSQNSTFSLEINKDNIFFNPLLFLKPSQIDNQDKKFLISSVLLESGIFIKFINKERLYRIPLRKDFNIYVYAFEQPLKTYQKALPKTIELEIKDTTSSKIIFQKTINLSKIQNNKMNNQWSTEELYRKYSTINMIKIGNWSQKERLSHYTVSVKAISFYGAQDTMTFSLQFY